MRGPGVYGRLVLLMLVLLMGCHGPLARQLTSKVRDWQPSGERGERKEKATPRAFDATPFDVTRTKLPSAYEGNDIVKVYASFEQGSAGGTDVRAFRESLSPGPPGNDLWYDGSRSIFKVRIRVEPFFDSAGNVDGNRVSFVVAGYSGKAGSRQKRDQEAPQEEWLLWEVSTENGKRLREKIEMDRSGPFLVTEGRVPPQADISIKDIAALLVCRPRSAQEGISVATGSPSGIEGRGFMHYYLKSYLLELWVYDYRTGQIFAKNKILALP